MKARFYDGRTAAPQMVTLALSVGRVTFRSHDQVHGWPVDDVAEERLGDLLRLSCAAFPAARLLVEASDWRALRGHGVSATDGRQRRREHRLIAALSAAAGFIVLFVFVIVPALSGPLARATPVEWEARLGESLADQLRLATKLCEASPGGLQLYKLGERLEEAADTPYNIEILAVQAPFANAFALPGGQIMVTDDLIREARSPDELSAVIAHEVAHVERRHVIQAVWRTFGLGLVLDAVVGGGSGAGQQAVLLAGSATNLRFSRALEAEADQRGMQLLQSLGRSSQGMAPFFERMAAKSDKGALAAVEAFASSHPDSRRRAAAARRRERPGAPAFNAAQWSDIKAACETPAPPNRRN